MTQTEEFLRLSILVPTCSTLEQPTRWLVVGCYQWPMANMTLSSSREGAVTPKRCNNPDPSKLKTGRDKVRVFHCEENFLEKQLQQRRPLCHCNNKPTNVEAIKPCSCCISTLLSEQMQPCYGTVGAT